MTNPFQDRIASSYAELSDQLKHAADFVMDHGFDVASRSMRSVAKIADLPPSTFTRLSRALGYEDYDAFREACRRDLVRQDNDSVLTRAARLQASSEEFTNGTTFFSRQLHASLENMQLLAENIAVDQLDAIVDALINARSVIVAGELSSAGFADYMSYLASWTRRNWRVLGRFQHGVSFPLEDISSGDVFMLITKNPYATRSINALQLAKKRGATVVLLTDSHKCPALPFADHFVIMPTESPQFFSSYVATCVVIETIIGMVVMQGGEAARERIASIEATNRQLGQYWAD